MSGARPLHLSRRGAVYVVRFTLPRDLPPCLSGMEIRKSLQTKNIDDARAKCLDAEIWFQRLLSRLRIMNNPSRKDVELAANLYFDRLKRVVDVPRDFLSDDLDNEIDFNIEESSKRIAEINTQLLINNFDDAVKSHAQALVAELQTELSQLEDGLGVIAMQLAAKAEREQNRYFIHQISEPYKAFSPDDDIFKGIPVNVYQTIRSSSYSAPEQSNSNAPTRDGLTLSKLVQLHIAELKDRGNGETNIAEFSRISTWLLEEIDGATPISSIETASLRDFRDKLRKRNKERQGIQGPLSAHLTDDPEQQILTTTASRYWGYIQAMFRLAVSEGHLAVDPAVSLKVTIRNGESQKKSVEFSTAEVWKYFKTPIFAGYRSRSSRFVDGACFVRDAHWWSGVIPVFTGMRASELSQLFPADFVFDADIPHILIRPEDEDGKKTKTVKTPSSVRAVPIADELLELGIQHFVKRQSTLYPKQRVFREFLLGVGGKKSAGMGKFWGRHFRHFGLHKLGRGTHVWRHTVVDRLRSNFVAEEDIMYLVGHASGSQTSAYGSKKVLERVRENCLKKLDYGFNVVETLGGPYDAKRHEV